MLGLGVREVRPRTRCGGPGTGARSRGSAAPVRSVVTRRQRSTGVPTWTPSSAASGGSAAVGADRLGRAAQFDVRATRRTAGVRRRVATSAAPSSAGHHTVTTANGSPSARLSRLTRSTWSVSRSSRTWAGGATNANSRTLRSASVAARLELRLDRRQGARVAGAPVRWRRTSRIPGGPRPAPRRASSRAPGAPSRGSTANSVRELRLARQQRAGAAAATQLPQHVGDLLVPDPPHRRLIASTSSMRLPNGSSTWQRIDAGDLVRPRDVEAALARRKRRRSRRSSAGCALRAGPEVVLQRPGALAPRRPRTSTRRAAAAPPASELSTSPSTPKHRSRERPRPRLQPASPAARGRCRRQTCWRVSITCIIVVYIARRKSPAKGNAS